MQSHNHIGGDTLANVVRHRGWRRMVFLTAAGALVLGTIGYRQYDPEIRWVDAVYHSAQHFMMHAPHLERHVPWTLELARWLAPVTLLLGLFRLVRLMFQEESRQRSLRKLQAHVIICGLGRKGMELAASFCQGRCDGGKREVVVLDKSPEPDFGARCEKLGAHVLIGDATQQASLEQAGLARAASLFALCPEDATNCSIAAQVMKLRKTGEAGRLVCHIHLTDVDLREALQRAPGQQMDGTRADFRFFDAYDPEARQLVAEGLPLDHDGLLPSDSRSAHLVILGFGRMGRTLALRAAQLGVFANDKRLRISVIDRRADSHRDELLFRHPQIMQVADLEFHQQEVASPKTRELLKSYCADKSSLTSIAVCFENETLALELSLELLPMIEETGARLAVRMAGEQGLAQILAQIRPSQARSTRIEAFGMEEWLCRFASPDGVDSDAFARRIHAEYERIVNPPAQEQAPLAEDETRKRESEQWFKQPEDFRESCRQQAAHIHVKLRAVGCEAVPLNDPRPPVSEFTSDQLEMLARLEHNRWMAERWIANWQFAPGKKDIVRRSNPNLVPWEQLDREIQKYDREFVRLIPRLLEVVGLKVCRRNNADYSRKQ